MSADASNGELQNRDGSSRQTLRRVHRGRRRQLLGAARRDHGFSRPQRRGQIDLDPHAVRIAAPERRPRRGGRRRRRAQARDRAREHRLHVAEVLALQRPFGGREPALLRRNLWGEGPKAGAARRLRGRNGRARGSSGRAGRQSLRRLEAAPRARLRGAARAADPAPRRADDGVDPIRDAGSGI